MTDMKHRILGIFALFILALGFAFGIALGLTLLTAPQADAANRFWNPYIVSGAVSGTGGVCRLTISPAIVGGGLTTSDTVTVSGITGATGCDVTAQISAVVDTTHIELTGTTFGGVYATGGCVAGGEWTTTNTANWATTSTSTCGSGGSSVPGSADAATFDANSLAGTVSPNFGTSYAIGSLTTGAYVGTLDFSVYNPTPFTIGGLANGWNNSGSATRTINLGSGTFTMTDTSGTIWNWTTTTGLTLNAGTSTILFSATATGSRNFIAGTSKTYYNLTVANAAANTGLIALFATTSVAFNNVTLTNVRQAAFPANLTTTISGALSYSGSGSQYGFLTANGGAAASLPVTISVANATSLSNLLMQNIIQSGAGSIACNPCIDGGGNTTSATFTITPPSGGGGGRIIGG
jgi:hypothetical protein